MTQTSRPFTHNDLMFFRKHRFQSQNQQQQQRCSNRAQQLSNQPFSPSSASPKSKHSSSSPSSSSSLQSIQNNPEQDLFNEKDVSRFLKYLLPYLHLIRKSP